MKSIISFVAICFLLFAPAAAADKLVVVATLPDYAWAAEEIGGDLIEAHSIARGNQDAHFVRPRPSYTALMRKADLFISTGLDLELWVPTLLDASGNSDILEGRPGYVAAWPGIELLEIPDTLSRSEGDVHVYGNPHVTTSPINMKVAASNIAAGLIKNDAQGRSLYEENLSKFHKQLDERLFGTSLVEILGGETLCSLAEQDKLISFLEQKKYQEKPLIEYLGGWILKGGAKSRRAAA